MSRSLRVFGCTALIAASISCATTKNISPEAQAIVAETIYAVTHVQPMTPPSQKHGELGIDQAYLIQDMYATERGDLVGYKIAFASEASQKAWGLTHPVYGPLFESQRVENEGTIQANVFTHFRIETEIAFVLGSEIDKPLENIAQLKSQVKSLHLAFDVPDKRFNSKPTAADVIATGAGAHRFILGPSHDPKEVDIDNLTLKAIKDDQTIYQGPSNAVMGGQWECLFWAINHLLARGKTLKAGTLFLTGAVDKAYGATVEDAAGTYLGDGGALGKIRVTVK
ncbi:MAG: hypothetical protein GY847_37755 [Proteobacteria bacterium]|nr:hypothetical protein [Pseudomonadota bacterium]